MIGCESWVIHNTASSPSLSGAGRSYSKATTQPRGMVAAYASTPRAYVSNRMGHSPLAARREWCLAITYRSLLSLGLWQGLVDMHLEHCPCRRGGLLRPGIRYPHDVGRVSLMAERERESLCVVIGVCIGVRVYAFALSSAILGWLGNKLTLPCAFVRSVTLGSNQATSGAGGGMYATISRDITISGYAHLLDLAVALARSLRHPPLFWFQPCDGLRQCCGLWWRRPLPLRRIRHSADFQRVRHDCRARRRRSGVPTCYA